MSQDQFLGGQFVCFTGVVEDNKDPLQMGRLRVRCFGFHTDDKTLIPTDSLPWALVMMPVTSASMSGIGSSATGILQGSWVIGFFRDGPSAQDPVVMGTVPSISTRVDNNSKGFSDPNSVYPLETGKIDTPKEATSEYTKASGYIKRQQLNVPSVKGPTIPKMTAGTAEIKSASWGVPPITTIVKPEYPKNQAFHSESGHIREIDDTEKFERTLDMHKSGTYTEVSADGDKITTVVGNGYTVMLENNCVYIKGSCNLSIDGDVRQYVKGNYHLEVDGNKTEYIHGSRLTKVIGLEQIDATKFIEAIDTIKLTSRTGELSSTQGLRGIELRHPSILLTGNVIVSNGASGTFMTTDSKTVTVASGIVTNID